MINVHGDLNTKSWEVLSDNTRAFEGLPIPKYEDMEALKARWVAALQDVDPDRSTVRRVWATKHSFGRSILIDVMVSGSGIFRFGGGYNDLQHNPPRLAGVDSLEGQEVTPPSDDELDMIFEMRRLYDETSDFFVECLADPYKEYLRQVSAFATLIAYPEGSIMPSHDDRAPLEGVVISSFLPHEEPTSKLWNIDGNRFEQEPGQFVLLTTGPNRVDRGFATPMHEAGGVKSSVGFMYSALNAYFGSSLYNGLRRL